MSNTVKKYGGINLAQGIPGFRPPEKLLDHLSTIAHQPVHQYAPGTGNEKLLDQLVSKYAQYGSFQKDDFLITNGGTEAVSLLYTYLNNILEKPYSALAFEPVYESYKMLPEIFRDTFISFPLNDDGSVDLNALANTCRRNNVQLIFLNTPGNPFGKVWNRDEVIKLLQITKELDIYLIVDAVYQELFFYDKPYNPIQDFYDNLFYVNSFSKLFSITGWRIGYLVASPGHMSNIQSIHDYTGLCVPSVLQAALANYIEENQWGKDYTKVLRDQLKTGFFKSKEGLERLGFQVPDIEGGFFIWAKLPKSWQDGFDFAMELYNKQKVAVIPGEHFSENSKDYVRFNIAREEEEIEEALTRIEKFFNS
jgi:aspartate/methionine/tyrosine aminotransferase